MTTGLRRETATIYQFPVSATKRAGSDREEGKLGPDRTPRGPDIDFGSGWYHQEAVREAERTRKS